MSVLRFKGHTYVNVISNASNKYYKAMGHAKQHQGTCQKHQGTCQITSMIGSCNILP